MKAGVSEIRSAYERETILLYNQEDATADVYTFDPKLIAKLEELAKKYPEEVYLKKDYGDGAFTYIVPKECVLVREPYSKKRREAARERAIKSNSKPPIRESSPKMTDEK
jgi:hypothetical protein